MKASGPLAFAGRQMPAKQNQSCPARLKRHFLRRLGAAKLVEPGGWHQAAPPLEFAALGAKIDHRRCFRPRRRKSPANLRDFYAALGTPNDRRGVGRPNVVSRLEIERG